MKPTTWEELYSEGQRLRAENDALRLRVAVLEKAVGEANAAKHAANNRCQAVLGVCEKAIRELYARGSHSANTMQKTLEAALKSSDSEDPALKERAAIVRKIRQDAKISRALARFDSGRGFMANALNGLADEIEAGMREQVDDGQG